MPTIDFSSPKMANPPARAITMPSAVPASWLMKVTPPRPPSALVPKIPHASPPQAPQSPCSGQTPSTSSTFQRSWVKLNIQTKIAPATAPVVRAPSGCITSDPAQIATSPASGPLCTKPGSLRPTISPAIVPPAIAMSEFIATSPEILSMVWALITLNPNQPTDSAHAPSARNGMFEGGNAITLPSLA